MCLFLLPRPFKKLTAGPETIYLNERSQCGHSLWPILWQHSHPLALFNKLWIRHLKTRGFHLCSGAVSVSITLFSFTDQYLDLVVCMDTRSSIGLKLTQKSRSCTGEGGLLHEAALFHSLLYYSVITATVCALLYWCIDGSIFLETVQHSMEDANYWGSTTATLKMYNTNVLRSGGNSKI